EDRLQGSREPAPDFPERDATLPSLRVPRGFREEAPLEERAAGRESRGREQTRADSRGHADPRDEGASEGRADESGDSLQDPEDRERLRPSAGGEGVPCRREGRRLREGVERAGEEETGEKQRRRRGGRAEEASEGRRQGEQGERRPAAEPVVEPAARDLAEG